MKLCTKQKFWEKWKKWVEINEEENIFLETLITFWLITDGWFMPIEDTKYNFSPIYGFTTL